MNSKNIQNIYQNIMNNNTDHYQENILAASTVATTLGMTPQSILAIIPSLTILPARLQLIRKINGISLYDDIKSTTPWATIRALSQFPSAILICGGRTKGIDYHEFITAINKSAKYTILIKSELSQLLEGSLEKKKNEVVSDLPTAFKKAYAKAVAGDVIIISPAAAFFYSSFIKGKASLRKLITSLLPKEQV